MLVGFIVAFFTLMQVRESIVGVGAQWLLQLGALTIASAVIYSMFRVVLYGSLSGVLMHGQVEEYRVFLENKKVKVFGHALVDEFAASQLEYKTMVRGRLYKLRGHHSRWAKRRAIFWVQPSMVGSVVVAIVVVGVMFGWSVDTVVEAFGSLGLGVILVVGLSLRLARPLPEPHPSL
jgi:hypothetical protein